MAGALETSRPWAAAVAREADMDGLGGVNHLFDSSHEGLHCLCTRELQPKPHGALDQVQQVYELAGSLYRHVRVRRKVGTLVIPFLCLISSDIPIIASNARVRRGQCNERSREVPGDKRGH